MNLFYAAQIESNFAILDEEETHHCTKVFRHKKGDHIYITNGNGIIFKTQIIEINKKDCQLQILETLENKCKIIPLHIAIAPTKNIARTEWFLEKATEAGIYAITPIYCQHSERQNINHNRLLRIMIAAMKQSKHGYLPILHPAQHFQNFISNCSDKIKLIAVCDEQTIPYSQAIEKNCSTTIVIGPEGDFSTQEIQLAKKHNFIPISLGNNRFRTESAALYATFIAHFINQ